MELVEALMEKISFECVEEALLHAISKGATKLVKVIIEHPNYIAGADQCKRTQKDPFFRTDEKSQFSTEEPVFSRRASSNQKSQFSPDITPLILAAHYNNHEIIQMFISINHTIDRPHPIACQCTDCVTKQNYDSLKRSRSRLHAYRALASPAYMALSSQDPIMTTFQLRQEMKQLAQVEKEFKVGYGRPFRLQSLSSTIMARNAVVCLSKSEQFSRMFLRFIFVLHLACSYALLTLDESTIKIYLLIFIPSRFTELMTAMKLYFLSY